MIEENQRQQIAEFMPRALGKAIDSYCDFVEAQKKSVVPKDFASHHTACKTALAHIDLIIKLSKWAELPESATAEAQSKLAELIGAADINFDNILETDSEEDKDS